MRQLLSFDIDSSADVLCGYVNLLGNACAKLLVLKIGPQMIDSLHGSNRGFAYVLQSGIVSLTQVSTSGIQVSEWAHGRMGAWAHGGRAHGRMGASDFYLAGLRVCGWTNGGQSADWRVGLTGRPAKMAR